MSGPPLRVGSPRLRSIAYFATASLTKIKSFISFALGIYFMKTFLSY
jgi:hypothetical protein